MRRLRNSAHPGVAMKSGNVAVLELTADAVGIPAPKLVMLEITPLFRLDIGRPIMSQRMQMPIATVYSNTVVRKIMPVTT